MKGTILDFATILPVVFISVNILDKHIKRRKQKTDSVHNHGQGIYEIDLLAQHSKLKNWNTELKFFYAVSLLIISVFIGSPQTNLLIIFITAYMTVVVGDLSLKTYLRLLLVPVFFVLASSIVILFEAYTALPEDAVFHLRLFHFYIYTTHEQVKTVIQLWSKAFGALSSMYFLTLSTPLSELLLVLERLHCPDLIIELMNIIYRFIFIMISTENEMRLAANSRLGYSNYRTSLRTFGLIASNLLIVSIKRANAYYDALESRLYTGKLRYLNEEKPIEPLHLIFMVLTVVYLLFVCFLSRH